MLSEVYKYPVIITITSLHTLTFLNMGQDSISTCLKFSNAINLFEEVVVPKMLTAQPKSAAIISGLGNNWSR